MNLNEERWFRFVESEFGGFQVYAFFFPPHLFQNVNIYISFFKWL